MLTHRFLRDQFRAFRMWILECPLGGSGTGFHAPADPASVEFTFLDRHARRDWMCQQSGTGDWPQYRVALAHAHDLVVAKSGSETLGWAWIGYEQVHLAPLGRAIQLDAGAAYLYDAYVRPGFRGRGIGRGLVRARCEHANGRGIERLLTHVLVGNEPSLRALRSAGFRTLGRTVFVRALTLRMWTRQPVPAPRRLVQSGASV
jgi:ribosomal protein S18 acetylase RimI-like enzyme